MTFAHRWIPEHRLLLVRHEGDLSLDALARADALAVGETTPGPLRILSDHRASRLRIRPDEVRAYADEVRGLSVVTRHPDLRAAMLVEDRIGTALGLLFRQLVGGGLAFEVFSTVEGACGFLGVEPGVLAAHGDLVPPTDG